MEATDRELPDIRTEFEKADTKKGKDKVQNMADRESFLKSIEVSPEVKARLAQVSKDHAAKESKGKKTSADDGGRERSDSRDGRESGYKSGSKEGTKEGAKNGAKDGTKASYDRNSKLTEMGVAAGTLVNITAKKGTADEKVVKLEVTDQTTVNDFLNACKDAGLTASFDTTQQRFFISSSESGEEDAFSITTSALSENAANVFNSISDMVDTSILSSTEKMLDEFVQLLGDTPL